MQWTAGRSPLPHSVLRDGRHGTRDAIAPRAPQQPYAWEGSVRSSSSVVIGLVATAFAVAAVGCSGSSESRYVEGYVTDGRNGIEQAVVSADTGGSERTEADGWFQLKFQSLAAGTAVTLTITKDGYENGQTTVTLNDSTVSVNI